VGQCPVCAGDSLRVVRYRQAGVGGEAVLLPDQQEPRPWPLCGRQPATLEVVELVVRSRDEAQAAVALAEGGTW
jgi:hypothetical protein